MSKHLQLSDRVNIAASLKLGRSLTQIAEELGKSTSTISREIRKHMIAVDKGAAYRIKNRCIARTNCTHQYLCTEKPDCARKCSTCAKCNSICPDFAEEICPLLSKPPYVCNGCGKQQSCVLRKAYYIPQKADAQYRELLHASREGYNMTTLELQNIDTQISPLLKQGQSIHHAFLAVNDAVTVSESTVARLIKGRQLSATVLDQQRVVKLKQRKTTHSEKKIDRRCREGRTIEDYRLFMQTHPELSSVEMDTVIGRIGGKSLLTLIFPNSELMLAFLCDCHTAACVQSKIEALYDGSNEFFPALFPVLLTDNGSEFSNPTAIETAPDGSQRTNVFYCDPMASWQKPHVERNHEFIRLILPKGSSFDNLTQEKVGLVMSHINSYARPSLGNRSPFEMFAYLHGQTALDTLLRLTCQSVIEPKDITLKPSLLG